MTKKQSKHTTVWEDQRTAMLGTCNGKPLPPGNSPILHANQPIQCPLCSGYIVLRWNVHVAEMSEEEYLRIVEREMPSGMDL